MRYMKFTLMVGLSSIASGCAQFMAPTETSALYTAQERAAFYSMVNEGVANTVIGISVLAIANSILASPPSPETMKEKWVSRGIKAYVEHSYVTGSSQLAWDFTGTATYTANFTELNDSRLFAPAVNLAYFCQAAGGEFRLDKASRVAFTKPSSFRPVDRDAEFHNYPFTQYGRPADLAKTVIRAQEDGAWGNFVCRMPEGAKTWWAEIVPGVQVKDWSNGMGWKMPITIGVFETPPDRKPEMPYAAMKNWQHTVTVAAYGAGKRYTRQEGDLIFEAWPADEKKDRWGCRQMVNRVLLGDRPVSLDEQVLCI